MPKILFLVTELDIGGAEINLFRLARGLKSRGWEVEAACLSGRGEVGRWLAENRIPVHYVDMRSKMRLGWFARLVRLIRLVRPDVLHTFLFHANAAGRLANIFAGVPRLVSSIRVAERRRRSHLYVDFLTQSLVDREICVSDGVREFTRRAAHIREDKLVVIPNPVERPAPARGRDQIRESLGARPGDMLILSIGRLDVQKGYEYLLDAAAQMLARRPNLLFAIAGEGDRRSSLEQRIERAGIARRFRLLGWQRNTGDLYAAADLFVLPSLWEGMPNSLLEAASAALPIVATSVEGSREIIDDGQTGLLVPPADSVALQSALERLLDDAPLRETLARNAAERILARHSVEQFIDAHEALYAQLMRA